MTAPPARPPGAAPAAGDLVSWAGNVSTSVFIVFVNKLLMKSTGYGFHYGGWWEATAGRTGRRHLGRRPGP